MSQPLRVHRHRHHPSGPAWPSFRGTADLVGSSPSGRVTVYVDPTLGAPAQTNAESLVQDADRVFDANDGIFGTKGGHVDVIIFALGGATDGTGGADHGGCDYTIGNEIEVCAAFGQPERVSALFEAELSECSMGGRLCGVSTGEALSRWCAATTCNNALADFATAPDWVQNGMHDWVSHTDATDQDPYSTGCGMAFISWLLHRNNFTLPQIAQALVPLAAQGTFADLYQALTGTKTNPWQDFVHDVKALTSVTTDDPFA